MSWVPQRLLPFLALSMTFLLVSSDLESAEKRATIQGAPQANLRSGPGLNQPVKTVVKEGDPITVDGQDGDWYLATAPDGQKGYIHKSLVKFSGEEQASTAAKEPEAAKAAVGESKEPLKPASSDTSSSGPALQPLTVPGQTSSQDSAVPDKDKLLPALPRAPVAKPMTSVPQPKNDKMPTAKSPSLLQLLEGREADMVLWLAIALAFFFIGWICGGNYYVRRDRVRRNKLRF
jgi:uncharacterized protein YgiM (DUF1202 family)